MLNEIYSEHTGQPTKTIGTVSTPYEYLEFFSVVMVTCLELDVFFFQRKRLKGITFYLPKKPRNLDSLTEFSLGHLATLIMKTRRKITLN